MSALLLADAPRWLVLALVGLVAIAYAACGGLALAGRVHQARARRRPTATTPARPAVTS